MLTFADELKQSSIETWQGIINHSFIVEIYDDILPVGKFVVPRSGIDTDARWGFSHTKGWLFGYKLHITASTGSIIVPLSADFTQADVQQDNQIYPEITCSSSLPQQGVRYMAAADSGYDDDHKMYNLSIDRGFELVCPVSEIYNNTSSERLQLIHFYESELGQAIYSWRSISIEPLIEHIKGVFKIDQPVYCCNISRDTL